MRDRGTEIDGVERQIAAVTATFNAAENLASTGSGQFTGGAPLSGCTGTLELIGVVKPVPFDRH